MNTLDRHGGAELVARTLFLGYGSRGHPSWMAVRESRTGHPDVFTIPNGMRSGNWARGWHALAEWVEKRTHQTSWGGLAARFIDLIGQPGRLMEVLRGHEDFDFPGCGRLLQIPPQVPDLVHCHNLHGNYFDLRVLPDVSRLAPVVLTLHDAWLVSGHCAHSFGCDRWKVGCGNCPDLTIYPRIWRDGSAFNWQRKRDILTKSRVYVSTPSRWLMDRVDASFPDSTFIERRVIPNGIDLTLFRPGDQNAAKAALGIPSTSKTLLFAAAGTKTNPFKDYKTLEGAMERLSVRKLSQAVVLLALGETGPVRRIGTVEIRPLPFRTDPREVVQVYHAADAYIHAAKVDTFPNSVLEALACGVPIVATAVGGIPEQVRGLEAWGDTRHAGHDPGVATGILTPPADAEALAAAAERLVTDDALRTRLGNNAVADATKRFEVNRFVAEYLHWFEEILAHSHNDQNLKR